MGEASGWGWAGFGDREALTAYTNSAMTDSLKFLY